MTAYSNPAGSKSTLESRIAKLARDQSTTVRRLNRVVGNTVVSQMLPASVVKGGAGIKFRRGEADSRFTADMDVARAVGLSVDDYVRELRNNLRAGWQGFTGTVMEQTGASAPADVPDEYIMRPFNLALSYEGRHWLTIVFELGVDEVGSTSAPDRLLAPDILRLFSELGLPKPAGVEVIAVAHQIAQKLHACTSHGARTGQNDRAHDLVDLQILEREESLDLSELHEVCVRLFSSRRKQTWPPTVTEYPSWAGIYIAEAEGLQVAQTVAQAVSWANEFVARIVMAGRWI